MPTRIGTYGPLYLPIRMIIWEPLYLPIAMAMYGQYMPIAMAIFGSPQLPIRNTFLWPL